MDSESKKIVALVLLGVSVLVFLYGGYTLIQVLQHNSQVSNTVGSLPPEMQNSFGGLAEASKASYTGPLFSLVIGIAGFWGGLKLKKSAEK